MKYTAHLQVHFMFNFVHYLLFLLWREGGEEEKAQVGGSMEDNFWRSVLPFSLGFWVLVFRYAWEALHLLSHLASRPRCTM